MSEKGIDFYRVAFVLGYCLLPTVTIEDVLTVSLLQSGKPQFGYIYGVALLGCVSIYFLLNLISEKGIDFYRIAAVLGYLLPMVTIEDVSTVSLLQSTTILAGLSCIVRHLSYQASRAPRPHLLHYRQLRGVALL